MAEPHPPQNPMSRAELNAQLHQVRDELDAYHAQAEAQDAELTQNRAALEEHVERYARLYDQAPIGYATLDAQGVIEQINLTGAAMLGVDRSKATGWPLRGFVIAEDRPAWLEHLRRWRSATGPITAELTLRPRHGDPIHAQLITRPPTHAGETSGGGDTSGGGGTSGETSGGGRFHTAIIDITERQQAVRALHQREAQLRQANAALERRSAEAEQRSAQLRAMAAELTQVEQRERRRLAELLHGHLQQILVGAKMQLGLLRSEDPDAVEQVKGLVGEAIEASRTLTAELSPPVLYDAGLAPALHWLGRWMGEKHHLSVHTRCADDAEPRDQDVLALLFSAVRELLFNIVKHAGTTEAWVTLGREDDRARIVVKDAGAGFDPAVLDSPQRASYGLPHLRARLNILGGTLEIDSGPSRGTTMTLTAPLHAPPSPEVSPPPEVNPPPPPEEDASEITSQSTEPADPPPADLPQNGADPPIRLLLADDEDMVRAALTMMLDHQPDLTVIAQAADGQQAIEQAHRHRPDLVIMDVNMAHMGGVEATRRLSEELPDLPIIGLSMHDQPEVADAMKQAGACDYFPKDAPPQDLLAAIRGRVAPRPSNTHPT